MFLISVCGCAHAEGASRLERDRFYFERTNRMALASRLGEVFLARLEHEEATTRNCWPVGYA